MRKILAITDDGCGDVYFKIDFNNGNRTLCTKAAYLEWVNSIRPALHIDDPKILNEIVIEIVKETVTEIVRETISETIKETSRETFKKTVKYIPNKDDRTIEQILHDNREEFDGSEKCTLS